MWATIGLFAHIVRRGRLRLARFGVVFSAFSDIDFDLREAEVGGLATTVFVLALCGNVDVYVPERIGIDVSGVTVFGHRRQWGREAADKDSPVLRVRVVSLFGTVDVWHVPGDVRGRYRRSSARCGSSSPSYPHSRERGYAPRVISFARGVPAPECLAVEELADCARAALERDGHTILSYGPGGGYGPLRELLAERHGVEPSRIVITSGSLQGFVFLAEQLVRPALGSSSRRRHTTGR